MRKKVSSNKLYGIEHVLYKIEFHETQKSFIEQSFKVDYTINIDTTFKFHRTTFHRLAWALLNRQGMRLVKRTNQQSWVFSINPTTNHACLHIGVHIMIICTCNVYLLTLHFYIVKLGFTRVFIFVLFLL